MAVNFFEKEVKKVRQRFNQTFGVLTVYDLKLRQSVILAIASLGNSSNKIEIMKSNSSEKDEIKKFVRTKNILNNIFNQIGKERRDHARSNIIRKSHERGCGSLPKLRKHLHGRTAQAW